MTAVAPALPAERTTGGRDRVTARALERVARAVVADAFGVAAKSVSVRLDDRGSTLDLTTHTPVRVVSIAAYLQDARSLDRSGGGVLQRAAHAESVIRDRVQTITGRTLGRVVVAFSDAAVHEETRVR